MKERSMLTLRTYGVGGRQEDKEGVIKATAV